MQLLHGQPCPWQDYNSRRSAPQIHWAQSVGLDAKEAQVNSGVLHICQVHSSALVHFHIKPSLILVLHILLEQMNGIHDVQIIAVACTRCRPCADIAVCALSSLFKGCQPPLCDSVCIESQ